MTRSVILLLLTLCALRADDAVAVLKNLKNGVEIHRGDLLLTAPASGEKLYSGDILFTGSDGALSVIFNDGSIVSLGNKSILKIDDYLFVPCEKRYRFDLFLKKGNAVFETGKIGKAAPEAVTFRVPEGTIGVRGTKFFVEVP